MSNELNPARMLALITAQIASTMEALSDLVTTTLASLGQQRLAKGIDLMPLKDEHTSAFADAVVQNLEQAIGAVGRVEPGQTGR